MPINTKINSSEYSHISEAHEHDILVLSREIFLHGEINDEDGEDAGINSTISNRFLKNLQILESIDYKPITIRHCQTYALFVYRLRNNTSHRSSNAVTYKNK